MCTGNCYVCSCSSCPPSEVVAREEGFAQWEDKLTVEPKALQGSAIMRTVEVVRYPGGGRKVARSPKGTIVA